MLNEIGDAAIEAAVAAGVYRVIDGLREIMDLRGKRDAALSVVKAAQTGFGSLSGSTAMPKLPPRPETPR